MSDRGLPSGVPGHEEAGGAPFLRFAQALGAASDLAQVARRFVAGFGPVIGVPMYGFKIFDPATERLQFNVAPHVSDVFVARYARVMDEDPLRVHAFATGEATYNLDLMSTEEWAQSHTYRNAYSLHAMRHVVEAPIYARDELIGGLHFAASDPEREITEREVQLTGAVGRMLGESIAQIRDTEHVGRERDQALAALELSETAVVFSDAEMLELRFNEVARRLLSNVLDSEERVHGLLVRPADGGGFSRRVEVTLADGAAGVLHGHSTPVPARDGALVTVLELEHDQEGIDPRLLTPLTPREREVAALVVEGMRDREIADRLSLSLHTVTQYVRRIYRKLDVSSRVELTRLLLANHRSARRS